MTVKEGASVSPEKRSRTSSYVGTFATNLFIQGCTILQGILLARLLGPAGRGEFAAIILWPTLFAGVGILGVNMAIARRAGRAADYESLVRTAVAAALLTGGATTVVCGAFLPYLFPATLRHVLPAAYLFLLFIPLNHMGTNLQGVDHGRGNFWLLNVTRALIYPTFFIGLLLCWFFGKDKVFWIAVALLVANGAAVAVRLYSKAGAMLSRRAIFQTDGLLRESFPFFSANLLTILHQQFDKALLVWLLSAREIGFYTIALSAGSLLNGLNQALGTVTFTDAAQRVPGTGFPALARILRRGAILSLFGGVALGFCLPFLLPLVYGASFSQAVPVALWLLPGVVIAGLGDIVNQDMRGQGKPIAGVASKILGLVAIGTVGTALAGRMGASGIAVGYLVGEMLSFLGLLAVSLRFYRDAHLADLVPARGDMSFIWQRIVRMGGRA